MRTPFLVKAGTVAYGSNRGGDYSGMSVDPVTGTLLGRQRGRGPEPAPSGGHHQLEHPHRRVHGADPHRRTRPGRRSISTPASFNLDTQDKSILDTIAARLIADPTLVVTIEGYTDTIGAVGNATTGNQKLSDDRALAVFNYLRTTHGIAANRLTRVGYGERQLLVPTADEVELEANRAVRLTIDRLVYTGSVNAFNDSAVGTSTTFRPTDPAASGWACRRRGPEHRAERRPAVRGLRRPGRPRPERGRLTHNNTDIFVVASDDQGRTWTALDASPGRIIPAASPTTRLVRVNDDSTGRSQFFSWLSVDPETGQRRRLLVRLAKRRRARWAPATPTRPRTTTSSISPPSASTAAWAGRPTSRSAPAPRGRPAPWRRDFGDYTGSAFVDGTFHMTWADNSADPANPAATTLTDTDAFYARIALTDVGGSLTGNGAGLTNAADFGPSTITLPQDNTADNTSLDDLADDLQRVIDQKLFDAGAEHRVQPGRRRLPRDPHDRRHRRPAPPTPRTLAPYTPYQRRPVHRPDRQCWSCRPRSGVSTVSNGNGGPRPRTKPSGSPSRPGPARSGCRSPTRPSTSAPRSDDRCAAVQRLAGPDRGRPQGVHPDRPRHFGGQQRRPHSPDQRQPRTDHRRPGDGGRRRRGDQRENRRDVHSHPVRRQRV